MGKRRVCDVLLLSSVYTRETEFRRQWCWGPLPAALLLYLDKGSAVLQIEGGEIPLLGGHLYLIPAGTALKIEAKGGSRAWIVWLRHMHDASLPDVPPPAALITDLLTLPAGRQLQQRMESLAHTYRTGACAFGQLLVQALVYDLLNEGERPTQRALAAASPDGAAADMTASIAYMERHFAVKIRLEQLAALSGLTPTSYSREFKKLYSVTPMAYLTSCRIREAKQLLVERQYSVKDVAAASGFRNEFYFSRMFKRETGMSPTLYMKRSDLRVATLSCFCYESALRSLDNEPVFYGNLQRLRMMDDSQYKQMLAASFARLDEARPELIICDFYHRQHLEQLRRIAPTVAIELTMDWRQVCRKIAGVIGRQERAERKFIQFEDRLAEVRAHCADRIDGMTLAFVRVSHKLVRIQGSGRHPLNDLLFGDVGFSPAACVPFQLKHMEYAPQMFPQLDADLLLVQTNFTRSDDRALYERLRSSGKWRSSRAVQHGSVHGVDNWVALSWSPEGRMQILGELQEILG